MEKKKNVFEITVKMNKEEFDQAIDQAYEKEKANIKLDGFRKGNVPKNIYFNKVGKESLYTKAVDILLPKAYEKALKEGNYEPILQPKVDIKSIDENGVEFEFTITTMPEVTIKKYKGLKVAKKEVKVTDDEIDHEIKHMLDRYSEMVVKEGEVAEGDVAIIDFEGMKDGVAFKEGTAENYSLEIGSHTFIPGFEEQVVGMKKGEEKEINVTFPEDYPSEELKGQPVVFKVKVNEIKTREERKLDEEFFEDLAMEGVHTEEELKKEIKKNLEANKEKESEDAFIDDLLKAVGKETEVEIPEELIQEEVHHMVHHFEEQLRMQGISLDVYFSITKSTREDLEKQMEEEAKNHILYRFIIDTIKEQEKIVVEDSEVEAELKNIAEKYQMPAEEVEKMYGGKDMLKYELEVRKTIDFLKENN